LDTLSLHDALPISASSEVLRTFGLSGTEKIVCVCIEQAARVHALMTSVVERLEFVRPGHGIAFIMPVSGLGSVIAHVFSEDFENNKERWARLMTREMEDVQDHPGQLVVAIVNKGFSDVVMETARSVGARGGTIIHARRTDVDDDVKFFGISLQSEKEVVAIVAKPEQKKELMQAVNKACGLRTDAHGIVISVPVESYAGIDMGSCS
jgi:hypothetical protein